jgi:hypothetical protein
MIFPFLDCSKAQDELTVQCNFEETYDVETAPLRKDLSAEAGC